jgi:C4-dicarboxylate-specific signal transduction histidine kinase
MFRESTNFDGDEAQARESALPDGDSQAELAHANRVATIGYLTASIVHDVKQPIATMVTNAQAALHFLDRRDLDEAREALSCIVRDGARAEALVERTRDFAKKRPRRRDRVEINSAIREAIELIRTEAVKNGVSVQTALVGTLPSVSGDRVELQQVILNLIINGIEAMTGLSEGPREVLVTTEKAKAGGVLVSVRDSGCELKLAVQEDLFKPFHTTKPNGLGLGLSICRSIIEGHGGHLWATANTPRGAIFQFALPSKADGRRTRTPPEPRLGGGWRGASAA